MTCEGSAGAVLRQVLNPRIVAVELGWATQK